MTYIYNDMPIYSYITLFNYNPKCSQLQFGCFFEVIADPQLSVLLEALSGSSDKQTLEHAIEPWVYAGMLAPHSASIIFLVVSQ